LLVGVVLFVGMLVAVELIRVYTWHYEAGFARIDGCHVESEQILICSTPVGEGDILLGAHVSESTNTVAIVVRASIWVPGRDGFKNLSATLDTTRIVLAAPLGDRSVINGATGEVVRRY